MSGERQDLLQMLLAVESRGAALHAALEADPELGLTWRAQAAFLEASAALRLEDLPILAGDIIGRDFEDPRLLDPDIARPAEIAAGIVRLLGEPPSLIRHPERALGACWRAGHAGTEMRLPGEAGVPELAEAGLPDGLSEALARAVEAAPCAVLAGLAAALDLRTATLAARPVAERLLFLLGAAAWRSPAARTPGWSLLPSAALTQPAFRAWSPGTAAGLRDLLSGLDRQLSRDIGLLPVLRRWQAQAAALGEGRRGGSRMRDAITHVMRNPVLTPASLARALGITTRGALKLITEAEAAGLLRTLVGRRSWRVWAARPLADVLQARSIRADRLGARRDAAALPGAPRPGPDLPGRPPDMAPAAAEPMPEARLEKWRANESAALAELQAAMQDADALLARLRQQVQSGPPSRP